RRPSRRLPCKYHTRRRSCTIALPCLWVSFSAPPFACNNVAVTYGRMPENLLAGFVAEVVGQSWLATVPVPVLAQSWWPGYEVLVVEGHAPEVVRQRHVRVQVQPPAMILEVAEAGVYRGALVEVPAVLLEQVRLHADGAVLPGDGLRGPVAVRRHHHHRVEV